MPPRPAPRQQRLTHLVTVHAFSSLFIFLSISMARCWRYVQRDVFLFDYSLYYSCLVIGRQMRSTQHARDVQEMAMTTTPKRNGKRNETASPATNFLINQIVRGGAMAATSRNGKTIDRTKMMKNERTPPPPLFLITYVCRSPVVAGPFFNFSFICAVQRFKRKIPFARPQRCSSSTRHTHAFSPFKPK